jgi:uncharacterized protein (TIGR01440 family)
MTLQISEFKVQLQTVLNDLQEVANLSKGQMVVIGCSTSEVMGEQIGTSGTLETAEVIFETLHDFAVSNEVELAFQCCEHLNRALVVERQTALEKGLEMVTVVPVRKAGGAMATYAYKKMNDPVVVEFIKADAGIDIGDTFIGMHLKHVAVPVRSSVKRIGHAHVTLAKTRPKLIGGNRAVYENEKEEGTCD